MNPPIIVKHDEKNTNQEEINETLSLTNLPKHTEIPGLELSFYQGCWHVSRMLPSVIKVQQKFQAQDTDIILVSKPKCGTTWLKSLVYSIIHRTEFTYTNHPLLTHNPHELVPFLTNFYTGDDHNALGLNQISSPRIFATHDPYVTLNKSMKESACKIVYIARNPFDVLVSGWHFTSSNELVKSKNGVSFETYFDLSCRGMEPGGPHWDHVLGYWKQSLDTPNKVLFLKYEDLKEDGVVELKRLAKFLGCEFSLEEEEQGVIEKILELCSLKNLKELEVNKTGILKTSKLSNLQNKTFFRKGEIGDWVNHLSPLMFERLDQVIKLKFAGSGLEFKIHPSK
ncbi:cytosolic sulfotransferase 5-like [Chenopodium quinoa]|uniref:cytosolic sulfotransferase 5-like n=1 Tax=Chenopodium quinoa TaxID=63459 RepID=UPI000B76D5BB|nr:cytosolic sulfotransferase 5-like [Chenopodium quinoa]